MVFDVDSAAFLADFTAYAKAQAGSAAAQEICAVTASGDRVIPIPSPVYQLPVATLQAFLDSRAPLTVDYIHGEDALRSLATRPNAVGFLFRGMEKSALFPAILADGALPRKTFSMGHAHDKRFYVECRRIR